MSQALIKAIQQQSPAVSAEVVGSADGWAASSAEYARGVFCGGTGSIKVTLAHGAAGVVFPNCQAGSILPLEVKAVATATTDIDLVLLF